MPTGPQHLCGKGHRGLPSHESWQKGARATISWLLRNFADHACGMLRVVVLFSPPRCLQILFLLCLLLLVLSLQTPRAQVKHAQLEQIEIGLTIHTSFHEL